MESKNDLTVSIEKEEGKVKFFVTKTSTWTTLNKNRHEVTTGFNLEPVHPVVVEVPGTHTGMSPEELGNILQETMRAIIPACVIFIEEATRDFEEPKTSF